LALSGLDPERVGATRETAMTSQQSQEIDDAAVADELRTHHAVMIGELDRLTTGLLEAAGSGGDDAATAKHELEHWIAEVLVPHAEEEEATTYRAASDLAEGRLLIESMLAEHVLIRRTAQAVSSAGDPLVAGAYGRMLFDIFDSHQRKENDIILPLLVASDQVSLAEVMAGGHAHDHAHDHRQQDHEH
jgi:hypothetical protein